MWNYEKLKKGFTGAVTVAAGAVSKGFEVAKDLAEDLTSFKALKDYKLAGAVCYPHMLRVCLYMHLTLHTVACAAGLCNLRHVMWSCACVQVMLHLLGQVAPGKSSVLSTRSQVCASSCTAGTAHCSLCSMHAHCKHSSALDACGPNSHPSRLYKVQSSSMHWQLSGRCDVDGKTLAALFTLCDVVWCFGGVCRSCVA